MAGLGLLDRVRGGKRGTPVRIGIADDRNRQVAAQNVAALAGVLDPLGFARLAGDHGNCVGSGRSNDGVEEVIEQGEAVGVVPEEPGDVAIDVAHDEFAHLRGGQGGCSGGRAVDQRDAFVIEGITIVPGYVVDVVQRFV